MVNHEKKKEIRLIMNDLINFKGRDLKKIHKEVSKYMTSNDNKNVSGILQDVDNAVIPKTEHHNKTKRKLVSNLKAQFYNKRNLIIDAIEKSGKPVIGLNIKNQTEQKFILKNGMSVEELDKILAENSQKSEKLLPKKEIAKYIVRLFNNENHTKNIIEIIDDIIEESDMNVIMRLLCETYCCRNSVDISTVQQKINEDELATNMIRD